MRMAMVQVSHVCVVVLQGRMTVGMGMRLRSLVAAVLVPVMLVVDVAVIVLHRFVDVGVRVFDPHEEPCPWKHQQGTSPGPEAGKFAQDCPGE